MSSPKANEVGVASSSLPGQVDATAGNDTSSSISGAARPRMDTEQAAPAGAAAADSGSNGQDLERAGRGFDSCVPCTGESPRTKGDDARARFKRSNARSRSHLVPDLDEFLKREMLFVPAIWAIVMAAMAGFIGFCQLLDVEPVPPQLARIDEEAAIDMYRSPLPSYKCLEGYLSACSANYIAASFFVIVAISLLYLSGIAWMFFFSKDYHMWAKVDQVQSTNLGQPWFWVKCWFRLFFEVFLQASRCFGFGLIVDCYAKTDYYYTIVQVMILTMHVILVMAVLYHRSEVSYFFLNFTLDISYLVVRWSLNGQLSMRAYGFVDFVCLASPVVMTVKEINALINFMIAETESVADMTPSSPTTRNGNNHHDDNRPDHAASTTKKGSLALMPCNFSNRWFDLSWVEPIVGCLALMCGALLIYLVVDKGPVNQTECTRALAQATPELSVDLSHCSEGAEFCNSLSCNLWAFNLYHGSGCGCRIVEIHDTYGCPGIGNSTAEANSQLFNIGLPFVQDSYVLNFETTNPVCRPDPTAPDFEAVMDKDLEFIGSFKRLRSLDIYQFQYNGPSDAWQGFSEIQGIFFLNPENLTSIDVDFLNSWPTLETFGCFNCPDLTTVQAFEQASLPRLTNLRLENVPSCPSQDVLQKRFQDGFEYYCTANDLPETCTGIPQWVYNNTMAALASTGNTTECFDFCIGRFLILSFWDGDRTGMLPPEDFARFLTFDYHNTTAFSNSGGIECFIAAIRENIQFDPLVHEGAELHDGVTAIEFLGWAFGGLSSCSDCSYVRDYMAEGYEKWLVKKQEQEELAASADQLSPLPAECEAQNPSTQRRQIYANLPTACATEETCCTCSPVCTIAVDWVKSYDHLQNGLISEDIMLTVSQVAGFVFHPGEFACWAKLAPECMSSNGTHMEFARAIAIANLFFEMPTTRCSDCERYPDYASP